MIKATIRLIAKSGFHGFTLADVGEAAGYSRGLPAHYFNKKDDLLAAVANSIVKLFHAEIARIEPTDRGMARIAEWMRNYARNVSTRHGAVLSMLLTEAAIRPNLREAIVELNARGVKELADELRAGIEHGSVRQDLDVTVHARIIFSFMRGLLSFTTLDSQFNAQAVSEEFIASSLQVVGTKKK